MDKKGIDKEVSEIKERLKDLEENPYELNGPEDLERLERETISLTRRLSDLIVKKKIQDRLDSEKGREEENAFAKSMPRRAKNEGLRTIRIRLIGGTKTEVKAAYYYLKGGGFYPGLWLLGIHEQSSPSFLSLVGQVASSASSLEEAKYLLQQHGICLNIKTIQKIAKGISQRVKLKQRYGKMDLGVSVKGLRVVIAADGGRIRIREKKRGPKSKKRRGRYKTSWREPKLLIIYTVNKEGKMDQCFAPFIEGTMNGPDAIFACMAHYLKALQVRSADLVMFVSDGARWIWNRVKQLARSVGISADQFYEVLDYYHAVEHLTKISELQKRWTKKDRRQWVKKQSKRLKLGLYEQVITQIRALCRGRGKAIRTERDYFIRNKKRLDFAKIKALSLPIGSGAIESAIRRVINLRLKGASLFWKKETAEDMLLLRSYYKAKRWNLLMKMAFQGGLIPNV